MRRVEPSFGRHANCNACRGEGNVKKEDSGEKNERRYEETGGAQTWKTLGGKG